MTVRAARNPPVPTEGYRWAFNRIGPFIENEKTGSISRLPNYYGPIPRVPNRYSLWVVLSPGLISLAVILLYFILRWCK